MMKKGLSFVSKLCIAVVLPRLMRFNAFITVLTKCLASELLPISRIKCRNALTEYGCECPVYGNE